MVMEFLSCLPAIEFPVDPDMMAIHAAVPCARLFAKGSNSPDPALAQALPGEQADLDLRLIQPTAMLGRVVNREPVPQPASGLVSPNRSTSALRVCELRLSITRGMVSAAG